MSAMPCINSRYAFGLQDMKLLSQQYCGPWYQYWWILGCTKTRWHFAFLGPSSRVWSDSDGGATDWVFPANTAVTLLPVQGCPPREAEGREGRQWGSKECCLASGGDYGGFYAFADSARTMGITVVFVSAFVKQALWCGLCTASYLALTSVGPVHHSHPALTTGSSWKNKTLWKSM